MKRIIACLAGAAVLFVSASAMAMTYTSAALFSASGVTITEGIVSLDAFGGTEASLLEGADDYLEWTHAFELPWPGAVTGGTLSITVQDDANDAWFTGNEPEFAYGTLEDGSILFGDGDSATLYSGVMTFAVNPSLLLDGNLTVHLQSFFGDAYVTAAELAVEVDDNLQAVPLPGAGLLLLLGLPLLRWRV